MKKRILISADLSQFALSMVAYGCHMDKLLDAEATIIHSIPNVAAWKKFNSSVPPGLEKDIEEAARAKFAQFIKEANAKEPGAADRVRDVVIVTGNPTETVARYANEKNFDLIIVGYRGQSTIERLLIGSTASSIARYASGSVLIYRPGDCNI